MSTAAVVILNFNGESLLQQFLPSVVAHSGGASIYVIDNHSADRSVQILARDFPQVEVIGLAANLGFCEGYNEGLKHIQADYFILLNSDVAVTPGWMEPLTALLDSDVSVAAVQPKILSYADRTRFEYAGAAGGFIDFLGYPFCRGRILSELEPDHGQYDDTVDIFWASGACMCIRSRVFRQLGGFDKDFFAHMEEIDLCWRIHRAGMRVCYTGASKVYHLGGGTLAAVNPKKVYYNFRNGLRLLIRNLPGPALAWKLPLRLALDWLAACLFLLRAQPRMSLAVLKAHISVLATFRRVWTRRRELLKTLPTMNRGQVYPHSIVVDFFLRRKRRFGALARF